MVYYVLLNGSYDHTFVGPFRSLVRADCFATEHENEAIGAFVLTSREMKANVREYGTLPVVRPENYQGE